MSEFKRLLSLMKPRVSCYVGGLLGSSLTSAASTTIIVTVVTSAFNAAAEKNMEGICEACLKLSILLVLLSALIPLFGYLFANTVKKITADIRLRVFDHMEKIPASYYENMHSGDSLSRITNDIGAIENVLGSDISSILSLFFTGVLAAGMMLQLEWRIASVLILIGAFSAYINVKLGRSIRKLSNQYQKNAGKLSEMLVDLVAGVLVIKMYPIDGILMERYREINGKTAEIAVSRSLSAALLESTNFLLIWIQKGGTFAVGTYMMVNGQCSVGSLLALVMLMGKVTSLFNQLGSFVTQFQISMAGAARVFEILDILPEPERYIGSEVKKANGLISMEEGTFRYAEGILAIDRISFHVPQGSVAAIVGPSGSGKSTVMKLLLGYYPLDSGSIFVNGKPMGNYTLTELRDMMAYVPQDAYLFDGTIEDNIRYGRIEATYEEIVSAAIAANLHEFIINQPAQYKTMVGERGLCLSGGQKQRIAIARALLKNAPILLLDEATSALDSESEQLVQEAVQTLMKGRTILMVAHRLSTIEHADVIYVMEKGKIAEWGNHQELLATKGLYNHLYKMQITYTQPDKTAI